MMNAKLALSSRARREGSILEKRDIVHPTLLSHKVKFKIIRFFEE